MVHPHHADERFKPKTREDFAPLTSNLDFTPRCDAIQRPNGLTRRQSQRPQPSRLLLTKDESNEAAESAIESRRSRAGRGRGSSLTLGKTKPANGKDARTDSHRALREESSALAAVLSKSIGRCSRVLLERFHSGADAWQQ